MIYEFTHTVYNTWKTSSLTLFPFDFQKQSPPKTDMRFLCHQLILHTCADTAKALIDLIKYIVNDGDLDFDLDTEVESSVGEESQDESADPVVGVSISWYCWKEI